MARNNLTWIKGDIARSATFISTTFIWIRRTSNIHLCLVNLCMMIKGVVGAVAVKGVPVCVYGPLAELVYRHVRKRRWMGVIGRKCIVNNCDMGEDLGHTVTEVKNAFPMYHNILTSTEEDIQ